MPEVRLITALGSSFAAGPGIEPLADASARRSARNYPHQLAGRLGARLVDLTVSGATTANLLDSAQRVDDGTVFGPQTDAIPPDADLITITAGGNDLGFIARVIYVAASRLMPGSEFVTEHAARFGDAIPDPDEDEVGRVTSSLVDVVDKARARAPAARILLVDYLTVLAAGSGMGTPFTAEEVGRLSALQDAVGRVFRDAAARTGSELVLASAIGEAHALGSDEPWIQPLAADGPFHPNDAGMTAIAAELERRLVSPPRRVSSAP